MSFCLAPYESMEEAVKRLIMEEIQQAVGESDNRKLKRSEAVHEVRKHCKKIRSVLRLARTRFEKTYRFENAWYRDTAKGLAPIRDADALIETYDDLLERFSEQIDRRAFRSARRELTARRKKIVGDAATLNKKLKKVRARVIKGAERLEHRKLELDGFDVEEGLVLAYRKARKAMAAAYDDPTAENFHEWRKQAKYHDYHMTLLAAAWEVVESAAREADELSDLLGDDHNLDVLYKTLLESPKKYGKKRDIQVLLGLIDRRSAELRVEARAIGARIFAEKPKAFGRRFRAYGEAWRAELDRSSKKFTTEPAVVTAAE
jgi:CHAD domain-containing protein